MGSAGWFGHFEGPGGVGKFGSHARGSRMLAGFSLPAAGAAFQRALPKSCPQHPRACIHVGCCCSPCTPGNPTHGSAGCKTIEAALCRGGLQEWHRCEGLPKTLGRAGHPPSPRAAQNTGCQRAGCWFLPQNISPRGASGPLLVVRHASPHPGLSFWDRSTSPGGGREPSAALPAPTCPQRISATHPPATF